MVKQLLIILFILGFSLSLSFPLQAQYFQSKDFERKGLIEYINITMFGPVYYWTNEGKEAIELSRKDSVVNSLNTYDVSFPNSHAIYKLEQQKDKLLCTHPNGQQQWFEMLPSVYESKDFEKKGLTEYIQQDIDGYWYYTSANTSHQIKLQVVSDYPIQVSFPNDDKVYQFELMPICFGPLICTHPDGRKQEFEYHHWGFKQPQQKFNFSIFPIRKGRLGEIKIGMTIAEVEQKFEKLRKETNYAHNFGFDGGGPAYLYYQGDELLFALIPRLHSDAIFAIAVISPQFQMDNGLHPESTVKEVLEVFPNAKVQLNMINDSEHISEATNGWDFYFFKDDKKQVGAYNLEAGEMSNIPKRLDRQIDCIIIY